MKKDNMLSKDKKGNIIDIELDPWHEAIKAINGLSEPIREILRLLGGD